MNQFINFNKTKKNKHGFNQIYNAAKVYQLMLKYLLALSQAEDPIDHAKDGIIISTLTIDQISQQRKILEPHYNQNHVDVAEAYDLDQRSNRT